MSSTCLDYLRYRYKSNEFSKIRLILPNFWKSGHLLLADNFFVPMVFANWRENYSICSSLISCRTHVSALDMYLTGWDNKEIATYFTKTLKRLWYDIITKLVFSKVFLKISLISLENACTRYDVNVKVWIYLCSLHPHNKRDSCTLLLSSEFCRIFENTFLLEHSWASASTCLNRTNTWKWVFYENFFTKKVKQSKNA